VDRGDLAIPVDEERRGQCVHTAVRLRRLIVADHHAIVDAEFLNEWFHRLPSFIVHRDAQHFEALVLILTLHLHEPRNLDTARTAPRGPEIQQYDLPFVVAEVHQLAVRVFQREIRRRLALAMWLHRRLYCAWRVGAALKKAPETDSYNRYRNKTKGRHR